MKKILFLLPKLSDSCSLYRGAGVAKDLRRRGYDIEIKEMTDYFDWAVVMPYDIIMIQRAANAAVADLIKQIKRMGIALWLDYDDNLLAVPEDNPSFGVYGNIEIKTAIAECLSMADVVSVTTQALKEAYSKFNDNIVIIPNAMDSTLIKREVKPRENYVLWRGTGTHINDIMTYAYEIDKAKEKYDKTMFLFLGYMPFFLKKAKNLLFATHIDNILYLEQIQLLAPKVMQVPLADNDFNHAKSNIAGIEGLLCGAVPLVPSWWEIEGCIKYSNRREYYEGLRAVLSGDVDIAKMNSLGWEWIMDNLELSKINNLRVELIEKLYESIY